MMSEIRVRPISNGTVIDHITNGNALRVLKILGITGPPLESTVSVVMHVKSEAMGFKDLLKLEDKELKKDEVDKIALISPQATINIIRDETVVSKRNVELPERVVGIVRCSNPNCITNKLNDMTKFREPVPPEFTVIN
ncbi:MAG TPA: aspartate carbamoyltransferase regulatory subunit, partial [Euryarchaeota archaeon]|nr:aspartate carbamoyltransferase regulatory subunit [Euryarchaeota archaeon]